jgi:putative nucleotidyltransferase with HDIG domain
MNSGAPKRAKLPTEQITVGAKPFASTAKRVLAMTEDANLSLTLLGQTIATDPALTARVMRMANSPVYRRGPAFDSIEFAVTRMGTRAVYDLVAPMVVAQSFQIATPAAVAIQDHSVGTGAIARHLSRDRRVDSADRAFLAGLLHDIGKFICNQAGLISYDNLPDAYAAMHRHHLHERMALGFDHAKVGAQALALWQLPEPIPTAVAWHHQTDRAYGAGVDLAGLVTLVCAADDIEPYLATEELDHATARELAARLPCKRLQLSADWLRSQWPVLREAKAESLRVLTLRVAQDGETQSAQPPPP